MSLSRRFLNMIVGNFSLGFRSLCCIDLTRQRFFEPSLPPPPATWGGSKSAVAHDSTPLTPGGAAALMMEQFQLPDPILRFETSAEQCRWSIDCFPLADCKVLTVDQSGRSLLFDAKERHLVTMPNLHKPKWNPIYLFVPNTDGGDGGKLFVMERKPRLEVNSRMQTSNQFEAFVYRKPTFPDSCLCQLLPPLPYLRDHMYRHGCHEITAYGVVDGGSQVCISVEHVGTYCLDTLSHTWSKFGHWTLPFHGKFEYVPELKLWFGFSADDHNRLAADDLSSMDSHSQPQLVGSWKYLEPHVEWQELDDAQLVNLGFGRFCIARFFHTYDFLNYDFTDKSVGESFVVLTSVEVTPSVHNGNCSGSGSSNGEAKLEMITHKSLCRMADHIGIYSVF